MKAVEYPYTRYLMLAGALSILGQLTGIAFSLRPGPYTTIIFMAVGTALIGAAIAIFAVITYLDAKAKAESVTEKKFKQGETVFKQGDPGDRLYVVKSGEVEVIREDPEKGDTVLAKLGPEEYFGEMALISDAPRSATVRCVTAVTVLSIGQQEFQSLYSSIPALRASIEAVVHRRK